MGFLVGNAAHVFKWALSSLSRDPYKKQQELLGQILKYHQTTLFGKKHKFHEIRDIRQFQRNCRPHPYEYFKPYIDLFISGTRNALFNSHILFFARTPGTTGIPKLIPVTYDTIKNYNLGVFKTACYYISEDIRSNSKIFNGRWLYLHAPPLLQYISKIPVGYITGLLLLPYRFQFWRYILNLKIYSPLQLMYIKNLEKKFQAITKQCISKKLTIAVGMPPVVINLLEYITKYSNVQTINEVFPDLQFALFSGVDPRLYKDRLNRLFDHNFTYREMYAASEGMLAIQLSELPQLTPLYDSIFFEFIPLKDDSERLLINEIKKGEEYSLIITTNNGLYAYEIGDIVKVVSEDPPAFVFSSRKNIIDIAGEKLSLSQVFSAIEFANTQNTCATINFCAVGISIPEIRYIFLIEFDPKMRPHSFTQYLLSLDCALKTSISYDVAFQLMGTLGHPELWILKENTFQSLEKQQLLDGIASGQIKSTHLSKDWRLLELFEEYVTEKISLEAEKQLLF